MFGWEALQVAVVPSPGSCVVVELQPQRVTLMRPEGFRVKLQQQQQELCPLCHTMSVKGEIFSDF